DSRGKGDRTNLWFVEGGVEKKKHGREKKRETQKGRRKRKFDMATPSSSSTPFYGIPDEESHIQIQPPPSPSSAPPPLPDRQPAPPQKKRRNLPGNPSADAEVIALSPKTLMATNRFVCEVCNKGFQREQNLQLHRRGHNLPWKLKQKSGGGVEPRRRVYLCPEPTCVHHHPSRALGDLTGIKKHFCRKHGEKKWRCDRCSKRYAVQSDWKAHSKTCGTREYRCDCGTLFSRRDSFITHRAFCDALAQESARLPIGLRTTAGGQVWFGSGGVGFGFTQLASSDQLSSLHDQTHPTTHFDGQLVPTPPPTTFLISGNDTQPHPPPFHDLVHLPSSDPLFFHNAQHVLPQVMEGGEQPLLGQSTLPQMSATMLLQRAAQIGATSSGIGGGSMQEMMMSSFADGRFGNVGGGMVCDLEEPAFREIGFTRDFLGMGPAAEMSLGAEEMKSAADSFCYGGRQG
ncbi:hypothetical protein HPP92_007298, partial [Vanilla planifolia]